MKNRIEIKERERIKKIKRIESNGIRKNCLKLLWFLLSCKQTIFNSLGSGPGLSFQFHRCIITCSCLSILPFRSGANEDSKDEQKKRPEWNGALSPSQREGFFLHSSRIANFLTILFDCMDRCADCVV